MFVIESVKNEENIETMITQAIHLLIQVTNNYTMSYCYSQNDNLVLTVGAVTVAPGKSLQFVLRLHTLLIE